MYIYMHGLIWKLPAYNMYYIISSPYTETPIQYWIYMSVQYISFEHKRQRLGSHGGLREWPPWAHVFEYLEPSWWNCSEGWRGVASLEEMCYWRQALRFQKWRGEVDWTCVISSTWSLPHGCGSRCKFSTAPFFLPAWTLILWKYKLN